MKTTIYFISFLLLSSCIFAQSSTKLYMNYGGVQRDFIVHLPTDYNGNRQWPVVFNLHGYGSDASQQEFYTGMSAFADANQFIVVYPDGIGNAWNVDFAGIDYHSGVNDVGFINTIIDTMKQLYHVDSTRIYSCGLSNGGFMSHRLACELSNRIAAIASVAGTFTDSMVYYCTSSKKVPVMQIHGTADSTVPYNGLYGCISTEATISFWLNKDQCSANHDTVNIPNTNTDDNTTVQKISYPDCANHTRVLFYKIAGGGHTWPNGTLDIPTYGNTNHDIDANTEIWNFLKQYNITGLTGIETPAPDANTTKVYPNPATTLLKIETTEPMQKITLINMLGETVMEKQLAATQTELDLHTLGAGIYFIRIHGATFEQVQKVVRN